MLAIRKALLGVTKSDHISTFNQLGEPRFDPCLVPVLKDAFLPPLLQRQYVVYPPEGPRPPSADEMADIVKKNRDAHKDKP